MEEITSTEETCDGIALSLEDFRYLLTSESGLYIEELGTVLYLDDNELWKLQLLKVLAALVLALSIFGVLYFVDEFEESKGVEASITASH